MDVNTPFAIDIQNLRFEYNDEEGVHFNGFNLQIPKGKRFGLFGPNGAGKTTLMSLMTGLLCTGEGTIRMLNQQVGIKDKSVNKLFGLVPQDFSFYKELSAKENMEFFGAMYGLSRMQIRRRIVELLEILGLDDVRDKPVGQFSGGMKRRVNLAIGVIHNPAVLLLDEPTVGVDVQSRHAIINYLHQLNQQGTTLIYTSHQLNEAEDLCNDVALIDEGQIIARGDLNDLLKQYQQHSLEDLFLNLTGRKYRD